MLLTVSLLMNAAGLAFALWREFSRSHMHRRRKLAIALLAAHERSAGEIMELTAWSAGTVYPILIRLEELGIVVSRWEHPGGPFPRRRVYGLNPAAERPL